MSKWFSSFIIHVNFKFNTEKISASLADITCNTHIHVTKYSDTCTSIYTNIFTLPYIQIYSLFLYAHLKPIYQK